MEAVALVKPEESLTLQKVGSGLFKSGLFPNAKNEYGAFAIVQYGRELGIGPMMSLKNINIISGQIACNAQLMLTLALQRGVTYTVVKEGQDGATIKFKRGEIEYTASFEKKDAESAGLLGKDNWKKYPSDMYFWRAVAKGIRRIAPDAVMGLYTADEISEGAFKDIIEIPVEEVKTPEEPPPQSDKQPPPPKKDEPDYRAEITRMLEEMWGGDEAAMEEALKSVTGFQGKKGWVEGKSDVAELKDVRNEKGASQLTIAYNKIMEEYTNWSIKGE